MSDWKEALESAMGGESQGSSEEAAPESTTETASVETAAPETSEAAESTEEAPVETKAEEPKETNTGPGRDASGKFTRTEKSATKAPAPGAETKTDAPKTLETSTTFKAPQSWKPTEREHWGKAPAEVQAAVARREAEFARTMQEVAPARQVAGQLQQTVAPYMAMIQAEGGNVMGTIANLMQTAAALRTAPAGHKAGIVANLISSFGIDPGMVAEALQGKLPQGGQQQQYFDPTQMAQQITQQVQQGLQQQQLEAATRHYSSEWEKFSSSNPYADEMKEDIGRFIQGQLADDYQSAYALALAMPKHSDYSRVIQQREQSKQANAARASTQRARAASSSLRSTPTGPGPSGNQPKDWTSVVEAALESSSGLRR